MSLINLYEIRQDLLQFGKEHNRPGTSLNAHGIVIHGTDTPGATDENESTYFHTNYVRASAHVFIDWDSITQNIPDNEQAEHAGATANRMYLGCELCQPSTHNPTQFAEVWKRGVWYTALKFFRNGWSTGPDLWSHAGISAKFRETDHTDPVSYFSGYGKTFANFSSDVDAMIIRMKNEQLGGNDMLDTAVILFSKEDYWAGTDVSAVNGNCAIFVRPTDHSIHKDAMSAGKLIIIGGPDVPDHPNRVYLSGKTKYDTANAVSKYLG